MVEPVVQMAYLISKIEACDREIRNLNVSDARSLPGGSVAGHRDPVS